MGISIGALEKTEVTAEERQGGLHLGQLNKQIPVWIAALGFDDLPVAFSNDAEARKVDGDLWVVALDKNNQPIDVSRYNPLNKKAIVVSQFTGAFTYMGDAQSGEEVVAGDDEQTKMRLIECFEHGIRKILIVGNIYKPNITWADVPNAYMRIYPEGVSDRYGNVLMPELESSIKSAKLTEIGQGVRCLVFAVMTWAGPGPLDWKVDVNPQQVPEGIEAFLTNLGITFD